MRWRTRDVMMAAAFALSPLFAGCDDSLPDDDDFEGDGGIETPVCEAAPLDCEELVCTGDFATDAAGPHPLPDCTTIEGNLTVVWWTETGLAPPECLRHVTGDLIIETDPWGDDLSGFRSLETVGQHLQIGYYWTYGGSDSIRNLDGLSNLRDVGGSIVVFGNRNLEDIDGLCNLDHATQIGFVDNPALLDVDGLEKLSHVEGSLGFAKNDLESVGHPSLQNVDGLRNVVWVGGDLRIDVTAIADLSGLRNLTEVGGTLYIRDAAALQNLDDLSALQTVGDGLVIGYNDQLSDISGLSALSEIGDILWISYNPALPTCQAIELLERFALGSEPNVCIWGNLDDGCDSVDNGACGGTIID